MTDWRIIAALISVLAAIDCGGGEQTFSDGGNEGQVPGTAVPEDGAPPPEPGEPGEPPDGDDPGPGAGEPGDPQAPVDEDTGTSFPVPQ